MINHIRILAFYVNTHIINKDKKTCKGIIYYELVTCETALNYEMHENNEEEHTLMFLSY